MPRPRQRACLQSGLRLNLNRLIRRGIIEPGAYSGREVSWIDSYAGEQIASGFITADMGGPDEGWFSSRPRPPKCSASYRVRKVSSSQYDKAEGQVGTGGGFPKSEANSNCRPAATSAVPTT